MKVGLFFGSFNPVHIGHLIISNCVLSQTSLDEIWFVVSPHNPLKDLNILLNEKFRKKLIDISIKDERKLKSCDVEFSLSKPSYSIKTLLILQQKYPGNIYKIILGADNFNTIKQWKDYEIILKNYSIYIYNRIGYKLQENFNSNIDIINTPLIEVSSTKSGK